MTSDANGEYTWLTGADLLDRLRPLGDTNRAALLDGRLYCLTAPAEISRAAAWRRGELARSAMPSAEDCAHVQGALATWPVCTPILIIITFSHERPARDAC